MTSKNFQKSMVNQDQEIIFEVVKVSGEWVFPAASSIVEATRGKNMYLRLTDDGKSDIFRLDSVKDGENAGETVFGFVGNGGMDLVELTATTDGTGTTTGSWDYEPGEGPAGEAIGESGKVEIFEASGVPVTGYPTYAQVGAALDAGKWPVIKVSTTGNVSFYSMTSSFTSAHYKFIECNGQGSNTITINSDDSVVTESQGPSVMVLTGTYDPDASPADYSGLPSSTTVMGAINSGMDVILQLTNPSDNTMYSYRYICAQQYAWYFMAITNASWSGGWKYMPVLVMTYAGPGNPPGWASSRALSQELRTATITEADLSGGHCGVNNLNALTTMTLTSVNSVTMHTNDYTAVNNFCVEIDNTGNSNDVTIDVQHGPDSLKYSVAGGNVVGAGKYMQLTCVGSCWTLAEFTVPTP